MHGFQGNEMLEELSFVIGAIYDASIDPTGWKAALEQISFFVGGVRATLIIEESPRDRSRTEQLKQAAVLVSEK
jgi:hypothetical protein